MRNHYVVTGGAGFIGSAIVRGLLREGAARVVVIDNLLTGRESNLDEVRGAIEFQGADIRHYEEIAPLLRGAAVVFHEAAIPSVPRSIDEPEFTHDVNVNGTFNVLRAARAGEAGRVVYAASSSAYGDTLTLPKSEDTPPKPISPYGVSKYVGELYAQVFSRCYGLETVCLRYFNVFGPRQDPRSPYSGVLSRFAVAFLHGEHPVIYGDGGQTRDFTYVENAVLANLLACEVAGAAGHVFNIGTGARISLKEVNNLFRRLSGNCIEAKHDPPREGDIRDSQADISRARELLGYRPAVEFEEGLRRTFDWYRQNNC